MLPQERVAIELCPVDLSGVMFFATVNQPEILAKEPAAAPMLGPVVGTTKGPAVACTQGQDLGAALGLGPEFHA